MLLGKAGAITASSRKIEYDSPSVERPNRLTIQCPPRAPRPHLTTAPATRNATTMSRIVPLAKPAVGVVGPKQAGQDGSRNREHRRRQDRRAPRRRPRRSPRRRARTAARPAPSTRRAARSTTAPPPAPSSRFCATRVRRLAAVVTDEPRRSSPTGSSTSAICCSVRIFFSRTSSMMPRPVFIASAASSVERS